MKAIHYDAEGDILTVTFDTATDQRQTGVELTDNLIVYLNLVTGEPLQLIAISYQAMLRASATAPITLDGLIDPPTEVRAAIITALEHAPLNAFLRLIESPEKSALSGRVQAVFTPDALQVVTAS